MAFAAWCKQTGQIASEVIENNIATTLAANAPGTTAPETDT